MSQIISVHSFRGGTGKSNLTANIAVAVASQGKRVAIVDTDIQSPGIHIIFGLDEETFSYSLNDYLWDKCSIEKAAYDVTSELKTGNGSTADLSGTVYLVPSSLKAGEIAKILREGFDVGLLNDGFQELTERLNLDYLFIDTHPGLNEETLLSIAISDAMVIILRPDRQDFLGTAVTLEVAQKLDVPEILLLVNKTPPVFDRNTVMSQVSHRYGVPVGGLFYENEEMLELASSGVFWLHHPDHPFSQEVHAVAKKIIG
ncbi:MAG: MinD/ParA family protein [Drouetiella hepatica Uher 2000/2452]|jgi:MinD-like ATPase involved in chromosome partitioning or flagellar assembly|uniref:MinD/ParA family protein n=1 Tax=Drouetiella hepatica Uher 2000/2452 TaxID=904376 RepID=A0A951Q8T3_9CYAN|nr:MinD/ParA family protein [Drouetiella hepatica Uher 2000/2452]